MNVEDLAELERLVEWFDRNLTVLRSALGDQNVIAELEDRIAELEAGVPPVDPPVDPEPDPEPEPGDPAPLPATVTTMHGEVIPVPGRLTVHVAKSGGLTSDPKTWSTGKVPGPGDRVRIQAGMLVQLDGEMECDVLVVDGEIQVVRHDATSLTLTTLFGLPSGVFWAGEKAFPLELGNFTCTFRPAAVDPADVGQYWNGLVWLGEFTVHGESKIAYAELVEDVT